MSDLIRGKIARVLNSREVALNIGAEQGVRKDMCFDILDPNGEDITDPDTGDVIGSIVRPMVRVKVTQVKPKLSVASTFKKTKINVGGSGLGVDMSFARHLMPPKWVTKYETLKTDEKTWEDLPEEESYVKVGFPVVQVLGRIDTNEEVIEDQ